MLQLKMHFHLRVSFHCCLLGIIGDCDFFQAFKRCVTTFLSRERECDENNTGQGNWSIIDRGVIDPFSNVLMKV